MPDLSIVIPSCAAYSDLWDPFFHLFWKHWPDCPFPVYLGNTGSETFPDARVTTLQAPQNAPWSAKAGQFVESVRSRYILLILEDYFLKARVDTAAVIRQLEALQDWNGSLLRLFPLPGPDISIAGNGEVGRIHRHAPYRVSSQISIWERNAFLSLLRPEESIWDWEWNGTERSRSLAGDSFYATYRPLIAYRHVVERGAWFWSAARDCRRRGVPCHLESRPVMTPLREAFKRVNMIRKHATDALLPVHLRRRR